MASTTTTTSTELGIDYSFIAYTLFAVLVGLGCAYYAMKNQKTVLAIAIVISSIAIFWYFGSRWFDGFRLKQEMIGGVDKTVSWPPQINYCPDFMSLKSTGSGTSLVYNCVDANGVTSLTKFLDDSSIVTSGNGINAIELVKDGTQADKLAFQNSLRTYSLTWEGIYDGSSFTGRPIPSPYPAT